MDTIELRRLSREVLAAAFTDLEPEICDLVRWADLAFYLYREEMLQETPITDDGKTAWLAIEELARRVKKLRKSYYEAHTRAGGVGPGPGTKRRRRKTEPSALTIVSSNNPA